MPKTSNNALILFARTPLKGQVKTRLYPSLDHETIFQLYSCFLQDSIQKICMVENTDLLIGISSSQGSSYFENLAPRQKLRIVLQEGVDLGERMRKTFADRFAEGYQKTVIIGSDSPSLPSSYLEAALGSDKDITLGPSIDGGYYLIGLRNKLGDIFDEVDWGTSKVLEQTFRKIKQVGASLKLLPLWYDVDRIEDIHFLKTHLKLLDQSGIETPKATLDFLLHLQL